MTWDGTRHLGGAGSRLTEEVASTAGELDELLDRRRSLLLLLERASLLRGIADSARRAGRLDISMIGDPQDGDAITLRGHVGVEHDGLRDLLVPKGMGLGGKVAALMRPAWVPDYVSSTAITHEFDIPVSRERLQAMIGLPMAVDGQLMGVLYAAMRQPARFGDDVIDELQRIADQGAEQVFLANRVEHRAESAAAAERSRIAAGLHDSVGAMLFSTGAELRALQDDPQVSPDIIARLRDIEQRVAETASLFRESLAALDETEPHIQLSATLVADCRDFESRTGVHARFVAVNEVPTPSTACTNALVALVREALLNVEKHAKASSVVVSLAAGDTGLTLVVADDGLGRACGPGDDEQAPEQPWSSGVGLRNARERLERLGGELSVVDNEDGGITVRAQVPTW